MICYVRIYSYIDVYMDNRKHRCEMKLNLVLAFPLCRPCWGTAFSSTTGTCFWTPPRGTVGLGLCLADPHQPTFTIVLAQKIDISKCEKWPPWRGFGSQFIRESSRCSLNVWKIQLIHQRTRKGCIKFLIYYSYNIFIYTCTYIFIYWDTKIEMEFPSASDWIIHNQQVGMANCMDLFYT